MLALLVALVGGPRGVWANTPAAADGDRAAQLFVTLQGNREALQLMRVHGFPPGAPFAIAALYRFEPLCTAPCGRWVEVPPGATFRVVGPGAVASDHFVVDGLGSAVSIDVRAGSVARQLGGMVLTVAGVATTLMGVLLGFNGARVPERTGGWITAGIGVGLLVPGALLWRGSGTRLEVRAAVPPS